MTRVGLAVLAVAGVAAVRPAQGQGGGTPQAAPLRIAYVNAQEILRQTPGYQAAESTFAAELRAAQAEMQRLQQQLDSAVQTFDQQSIALSPQARQQKQRELQQMQQRMQQRAQELDQQARDRERELLQPLQARVTSIIQGMRAEGNYALIFDVDATSGILAADPALDLTARVVQRLQQAQ